MAKKFFSGGNLPRAVPKSQKRVFSSFFYSFLLPPNGQALTVKAFLEVTLVSLIPRARSVFKFFLKKRRQFRCTRLLHSSKLVHLDGKNLACFT